MIQKILLVIIFFINCSCNKNQSGNDSAIIPPPITISASFAKGADLSWITQMETSNISFYDSSGAKQECMSLLKTLGMNTIRLRAWVNPSTLWNGNSDLLAKAIRAKNLGLRIMIDFHYSDTWADPGHQTKPAAWTGLSFSALNDSLSNYTFNVLNLLKINGVTPELVQVGNETNNGMLWPDGQASTNMANFAQLVTTGYNAVKSVFASAKVIVHISNGYDNNLFRWVFDGLTTNNAKYDVIGMSLYPSAANWASYNAQCLKNMNDMVSRYSKQVMICEVGMPWDDPTNCRSFISDLITKTASVTGNNGLGVLYWEPEAYNNWQGYTLGAFDNSGKPTSAFWGFK